MLEQGEDLVLKRQADLRWVMGPDEKLSGATENKHVATKLTGAGTISHDIHYKLPPSHNLIFISLLPACPLSRPPFSPQLCCSFRNLQRSTSHRPYHIRIGGILRLHRPSLYNLPEHPAFSPSPNHRGRRLSVRCPPSNGLQSRRPNQSLHRWPVRRC